MKRKIYIFYQSKNAAQFDFVALAADGTCLSAWPSASQDDAKTEARSAERQRCYDSHYPDGWELVWRGGPVDADTMAADAPKGGGSVAFIEGRCYDEFLRALSS
jgi:hypothetical protein